MELLWEQDRHWVAGTGRVHVGSSSVDCLLIAACTLLDVLESLHTGTAAAAWQNQLLLRICSLRKVSLEVSLLEHLQWRERSRGRF